MNAWNAAKTLLAICFMLEACSPSKNSSSSTAASENFLENLLSRYPSYFDTILQQRKELGIQVIYTAIDRAKNGSPRFTDYFLGVDRDVYFYPASTVKFPVAVLALQKLNELNSTGLDRNTTMITETAGEGQTTVLNDPSAPEGRPTIAHYIKKILLVSDNDAFNRLYEFLGQEYINGALHQMGYTEAQIIHRLSINLTDEQNRHTNPVRFTDSSGKTIFQKPAEISQLQYAVRDTKLGKGFMQGSELINQPFDFSRKNRLSLQSLHSMVRSVLFPEAVDPKQRFNLKAGDYDFLRRYMSMRPSESASPSYAPGEYWDNYVKMLFYGTEKTPPENHIRIFNKTGTAYGFLVESAYIVDYRNKVEFMVSAVIYCNSDGILNDDKYDYHQLGYPFLKQLGRVLYEHELKRKRKHRPDLSAFFYHDR